MKTFLRNLIYGLIRRGVMWRDNRDPTSKWFPTCLGQNFLYAPLLPDATGEAYFTKYHAEKANNPLAINFKRYKTDILKGSYVPANTAHEFQIDVPSAVPYAVTGGDITRQEGGYSAQLHVNGQRHDFGNLIADRYYYLPVREPAKLKFQSPHDLVVARPIPFVQQKKHRHRLVLVLFVDNFGWEILDRLDFAREFPNIHRFFLKGTAFNNCYASSNWTLPGVASLVSGKTLSHHGMFHSDRPDMQLGNGYGVLPEYFQKDGYLTFQVCGNTRKSPAYGYVKGYDRTVFKNEMSLAETLDAFVDHLRAFPERDHFAWVTIFDAHHTLANVPDVANQVVTPLAGHDYRVQKAKTPMMLLYNEGQTLRHIEELRRIDFHLGRLFEFLQQRYSDDEMLACIVADHGPAFTTPAPQFLSHKKTHVALMFRGPGVPPGGRTDEYVQNTDVMPTLLHLAGIPLRDNIDGRIPAALGGPPPREFALSELMYPDKPYEAAIKDPRFDFFLKSETMVDDDGRFKIGRPETRLYRSRDWQTDLSAEHPEVVAKYTDYVRRLVDQ